MDVNDQINQIVLSLMGAKKVVVLTGAGVSKESGIPTYREPQSGLWSQYNPEELGTPQGFAANPKLVWEWNEYRRKRMLEVEPNPAHLALADLQKLLPNVVILTQNIDGLHQRAGSTDVVELHGSIHRQKCSANCRGNPTRLQLENITRFSPDGLPICPYCGAYVRPNIVWFYEPLSQEIIDFAITAAEAADVFITVGTSGVVHPAAGLPGRAKEANHAFLVDINPTVDEISHQANVHLKEQAGKILPILVQAVQAALGK
jgi:NAD-dependent deacetylase